MAVGNGVLLTGVLDRALKIHEKQYRSVIIHRAPTATVAGRTHALVKRGRGRGAPLRSRADPEDAHGAAPPRAGGHVVGGILSLSPPLQRRCETTSLHEQLQQRPLIFNSVASAA